MNSRILLTTLLFATAAHGSSLTSLATANIQCNISMNYLTPIGTTFSIGAIRPVSASGANSAAPGCGGFTPDPNPPLTPQGVTVNGSSSASASGSSTYGLIQGTSTALDGLGGSLTSNANYSGSFDDAITVTGGSGYARFIWFLSGRGESQPGGFQTSNKSELFVDNTLRSTLVLPSVNGIQTFHYDRAFVSGDTIPFRSVMTLPALSFDYSINVADLRMFIQFYKTDGTPLTGLTVLADSGTTYAGSPEPASFLLVAAGALVWACRRR